MALPKPQVEKDLGEIIVEKNPGPGLMQPVSDSATTFKPPNGFTSWPALPGELHDVLGLPPTSTYTVQGAHVVSYVNKDEVPQRKHQLWIVYGEGGE